MKKKSQKNRNNNTFKNIKYVILETAKQQRFFILFIIFYAIVSSMAEYLPAIVNSVIISWLEKATKVQPLIISIVIILFLMIVFNSISVFLKSQLEWKSFYSRTGFIRKILSTLLNMNYEKLENPEMLDRQQRALTRTCSSNNGIQGLMEISVKNITNIVKLVVAFSIVAIGNKTILLILAVLTFIHFVIVDRTKKKDKRETWDVLSPKWRKLNYLDNIALNFAYGKEIRVFQMQDWIADKAKEENDSAHKLIAKSQKLWFRTGEANQILDIAQKLIVYGWLSYSVYAGELSLSMFILFLQIIPNFSAALSQLLDDVAETRKLSEEVNDYRLFVEGNKENPECCKSDNGIMKSLDDKTFELSLENVSFKYPGQESFALRHINLKIKSGTKLAVVGLNGSGKTTLIKLIMRLYEPTEGNIYLNGKNIKEIERADYYTLFAPVFQEINIYALSILENISMQEGRISDVSKSLKCIAESELTDKIEELPNGINTQLLKVIYEDGVDLSGGEKQKLALARALYKEARFIIFDEPTAALDAYAENNLYHKFDSIVGQKTAIYISHRLASTSFCDEIAVFSYGEIVEYGSHRALMKEKGLYHELFNVQAQYYQEEKTNG